MKKLRGVDLFCGVGGFALGMQQAGVRIVRSMDFNPGALEVHRANIRETRAIGLRRIVPPGYDPDPAPVPVEGKFQRGQIHKSKDVPHMADLTAILDIAPEIAMDKPDIIFGGPPCQAFASSGQKKRDEDERSKLTEAFAILVAASRPRYFVMENVPGLRTSQTFARASAIFRAAGYGLTQEEVRAARYGAPQGRERLIVAGCLGETDGWFAEYIHQYRTARDMTVADAFGSDFGTPLRDFLLPDDFDEFLDPETAAPPKHLWFRDRDRKRILDPEVDQTTRFYHATPGGGSSARIHRVDRPSPTLIRTTMHELPSTYLPLEGEPVDLREVYQPTFEEFAQMGGFPADWRWPDPIPKGARQIDEEMMARERDRYLMLANAVPPPLARSIGCAIVDHHNGKVLGIAIDPDVSKEHWCHARNRRTHDYRKLERYRAWLSAGKGKERRAVIQAVADLRNAKKLVAARALPSIQEEIAAFDKMALAAKIPATRRSQLRRALRDLAEFEWYQSYVASGFFDNDDAAYAAGKLHYLLSPQAEADDREYAQEQELLRMAEQAKNPPSFIKRAAERLREKELPPAAE